MNHEKALKDNHGDSGSPSPFIGWAHTVRQELSLQRSAQTYYSSKGHSWIDPGDDIDLTAIPLWVRVGFTPLEIPVVATRN